MINAIKAYFETLEGLSAQALDRSAEKLVRVEKRNVAFLIAHVAEMSRRKAELECGYKNTFDYCVRRLNLSEGSVALRLQVANVSRRFPQILAALAENRISLTVAGRLAPHLREDNVEKLLSDCTGMSKRAVDEYLVAFQPKPVFNPSIRKRPSSRKPSGEDQAEGQKEAEPQILAPSAEKPLRQNPSSSSSNLFEPAEPDMYNFRFSAGGDFKKKFERLAEVLDVENPLKNMAEVFEKAIEISLDKTDPKRKRERRLARERKRVADPEKSRPDKISHHGKSNSRYIPSEVRERVLERAGHQCQYQAKDGTRCSSRTGLEIEHERPFAIHRSHEERFLKALCGRHNRFQAERVYGAEFIRSRIGEKKRRKVSRCGARRSITVPWLSPEQVRVHDG